MRTNERIAIIGGGNMGSAIASGLLKSGFSKGEDLVISKRNVHSLEELKKEGVQVLSDNKKAISKATLLILAVKPFLIKDILRELKEVLEKDQIVISIAAGITLDDLADVLGNRNPFFRVMPNTAISIRESMTCFCCNEQASEDDVKKVRQMLEGLGLAIQIEEKQMDAATVLGACATAFALRFLQAGSQGGVEIGFKAKTAHLISAQTMKGAAELILQNESHPEEEIDKVTTPGGSTIAGLNAMEEGGFNAAVIRGIKASFDKIVKGK